MNSNGAFYDIYDYENKKTIGIVSGCFDLTHAGHYEFFRECKKLCDSLCVAVAPDSSLKNKGPGRPYQNQHIRLDQVGACRWVDEAVIAFESLEELFEDLVEYNIFYLESNKKLIYIVNEDAYRLSDRIQFCNDNNIEIKVLKRSCSSLYLGISTTQIAEKILSTADLHHFPEPTYEQLKMALIEVENENIELKRHLKLLQDEIENEYDNGNEIYFDGARP